MSYIEDPEDDSKVIANMVNTDSVYYQTYLRNRHKKKLDEESEAVMEKVVASKTE